MKWRIYYDDRTTFDSLNGEPEDAPAFGIQCIVEHDDDVGRTIINGFDWYYYHPESGKWWGSDIHGLLDKLLFRIGVTALLQGRNHADYHEIYQLALDDPDFPSKAGKVAREHP